MSDSDRGKRTPLVEWVFPVIGLVLALSLAFGIGMLEGSSPRNPATKQQQQAYAAAKERYAQAVAGKLVDSQSNYSAYPDEHADPCYYADNHDSADLCAQWRAAMAAESSARWTEAGFWIGFLSTILSGVGLTALLLSLRQTEQALDQTRVANEIARQAGRPWVNVEAEIAGDLEVYEAEMRVSLTIKIKNIGGSPAVELKDYVYICADRQQDIDAIITRNQDRLDMRRGRLLMPSDGFSFFCNAPLLWDETVFQESNGLRHYVPVVYVIVTYCIAGDAKVYDTVQGFMITQTGANRPNPAFEDGLIPQANLKLLGVGARAT